MIASKARSRLNQIVSSGRIIFCVNEHWLHTLARGENVPVIVLLDPTTMRKGASNYICTLSTNARIPSLLSLKSNHFTRTSYENIRRKFSTIHDLESNAPIPMEDEIISSSAWLSTFEEQVSMVEFYPPGLISSRDPHIHMDRIYDLMKNALFRMKTSDYLSSVQRQRCAQLVERLLHKVLSESLLTSQYAAGVVARQFKAQEDYENHSDRVVDNSDNVTAQDVFDFPPVHPTLMMYTLTIQAWSSCIKEHNRKSKSLKKQQNKITETNAFRAKDVLLLMISQWKRNVDELNAGLHNFVHNDVRGSYGIPPVPDVICYTTVIQALAKEGKVHEANAVLEEMIGNALNGSNIYHNEIAVPDLFCFRTVLSAWLDPIEDCRDENLVREHVGKARALLKRIEALREDYPETFGHLKPEIRTQNTFLQGLANLSSSKNSSHAWEAYDIWKTLWGEHDNNLRLSDRDINQIILANSITCNIVMNALSKVETVEAALAAEEILHAMLKRHGADLMEESFLMDDDEENITAKPNKMSFHTVLKAWAGASMAQKPFSVRPDQHAHKLLQLMERLYESDPLTWHDLKPDTYTFNSVMNVFTRCASVYPTAAERADKLFHERIQYSHGNCANDLDDYGHVIEPDNYTYNALIRTWCMSVPRHNYRESARKTDRSIKKVETDKEQLVEEAAQRYNRRHAPTRAEEILYQMYKHYRSSGYHRSLKPHLYTCTAVLEAWARSSDPKAPEKAERFLTWMKEQGARPFLNDNNPGDDAILEQRSLDQSPSPDAYCYLITMSIWLKALKRTTCNPENSKKEGMQSNYSPLECVQRIEALLKELETYAVAEPSLRPTTACYNTLLNACAYCHPPYVKPKDFDGILSLAVQTCQNLRTAGESGRRKGNEHNFPDETTYYWMLKVLEHWKRHMSGSPDFNSNSKAIEYFQEVFDGCCAESLVSFKVWQIMHRIMPKQWVEAQLLPDKMKADFVSDERKSFACLPKLWQRNVKQS